MKRTITIKLLTVAAALLSVGFAASAQDIDGISLWDKCTKEQLIQKYGQPVKYHSQEDNEVFPGLLERIDFKDVSITLDGNYVTYFRIISTKPRAMTKLISGGIGLGDSEEVLKKIENYLSEKTVKKDGKIWYSYRCQYVDDSFYIITDNGKIVKIYANARTC